MQLPIVVSCTLLLQCAFSLNLVDVVAGWSSLTVISRQLDRALVRNSMETPISATGGTDTSPTFALEPYRRGSVSMFQSSDSVIDGSSQRPEDAIVEFSEEEQAQIEQIYLKCANELDLTVIEGIIMEAVPTLRPTLVVKLRQLVSDHSYDLGAPSSSTNPSVAVVASHFNRVMESRLLAAKETLKELLNAGELRKLDAAIGSTARSSRLDVAFFNVLNINLRDAMIEERQDREINTNIEKDIDSPFNPNGTASRVQILRHVYTRCQEEMEKTLPAGTALLNKLLRTEQPSIRANLYGHYLTPSATSITSPDGKVLELSGGTAGTVLVPLTEFISAIDAAVLQIRTLENAKGTDKESAAIMVENCRQVAREARIIVGQYYGQDSVHVKRFEEGLQHVFRPSSPSSPYIKGQVEF